MLETRPTHIKVIDITGVPVRQRGPDNVIFHLDLPAKEQLTITEAPTAMDALRNEWAKEQQAAQRKTNRWFGLALLLMGLTIMILIVLLIAAVQR